MCSISQKSKVPSPEGVIIYSQGGKASDAQGEKTKLQATFVMKAVNPKVTNGEKILPEGTFGGSHEIYSNNSPEIISSVHTDKNQIKKNINFGNHHNNSKISPVTTVFSKFAYYIRISLIVQPLVTQLSLFLLDTGAQLSVNRRR